MTDANPTDDERRELTERHFEAWQRGAETHRGEAVEERAAAWRYRGRHRRGRRREEPSE